MLSVLLTILTLLLLSVIIYQDFRFRAISWLTIPLLFTSFAINSILATSINYFAQSFLFNTGFIIFQLIAVTIYFSLKNRAITNITTQYLGWGDILFFIVAAAVFSPVNFILFYLFSIIITLISAVFFRLAKKNSLTQIPLAGIMALLLFLFYFFSSFISNFNLYNDQTVLSFVNS